MSKRKLSPYHISPIRYPKNARFNLDLALDPGVALVGKAVKYINTFEAGHVTVERLLQWNQNFKSIRDVEAFILANEDNFVIHDKIRRLALDDVVWAKTALKLCDVHCRKHEKCDRKCGCLHVCRNFLLRGENFCPYSNGMIGCLFGHDLATIHNRRLVLAHNLGYLHVDEIQTLFRRRICRSLATMPQVCLFYNLRKGRTGCSSHDCKALHFCLDYLEGRCHGEVHCGRSHSLTTEENKKVLDLFGINFKETWSPKDLLEDLKDVMEVEKKKLSSLQRRCPNPGKQLFATANNSDDVSTSQIHSQTANQSWIARLQQSTTTKRKTSEELPRCSDCERNTRLIQQHSLKLSDLDGDAIQLKTKVMALEDALRRLQASIPPRWTIGEGKRERQGRDGHEEECRESSRRVVDVGVASVEQQTGGTTKEDGNRNDKELDLIQVNEEVREEGKQGAGQEKGKDRTEEGNGKIKDEGKEGTEERKGQEDESGKGNDEGKVGVGEGNEKEGNVEGNGKGKESGKEGTEEGNGKEERQKEQELEREEEKRLKEEENENGVLQRKGEPGDEREEGEIE